MSMLSHSDEFLDLYKYTKRLACNPSVPAVENDILGLTYTNKPDELERSKETKENG